MRKLFLLLSLFLTLGLSGQILPGVVVSHGLTAPPSLELLTFTTVADGFVQSPTGTWGRWGYGVDSKVLTGDGWIQSDYTGITNNSAAIGLSLNNTLNQYPWDFTLMAETSVGNGYESCGLAWADYSSSGASPDPTAGDKYRIKRTGNVITAEYYRGGVWTVIRTFTATSSAPLYLKGGLEYDFYLTNPKGYNIH